MKSFRVVASFFAGSLLLLAALGIGGIKFESGFRLAYGVLALYALVQSFVAVLLARRDIYFSGLRYSVLFGSMAVVSWLVFVAIGRLIGVSDSSHGGSLMVVVAGSIGIALTWMILLSKHLEP
jgi:hypothetical protein